jgi:predicted ABC-type ATPase
MPDQPLIVVIGGPNGAGKSTAAAHLVPKKLEFLNADEIAKTLAGYPSRSAELAAGRRLLERLEELEALRTEFAVEATLASRSLATRIARLQKIGYRFRLVFVFVPDVRICIERVARRVRLGGHGVSEETIRRRYKAGIRNFLELYQPIAEKWAVYDTIEIKPPRLIAEGSTSDVSQVVNPAYWQMMYREAEA